jgi:hypothetical protein
MAESHPPLIFVAVRWWPGALVYGWPAVEINEVDVFLDEEIFEAAEAVRANELDLFLEKGRHPDELHVLAVFAYALGEGVVFNDARARGKEAAEGPLKEDRILAQHHVAVAERLVAVQSDHAKLLEQRRNVAGAEGPGDGNEQFVAETFALMEEGMIAQAEGAEEDGVGNPAGTAHNLKGALLAVNGFDPTGIDRAEVSLDVPEEDGRVIAYAVGQGRLSGCAGCSSRQGFPAQRDETMPAPSRMV